MNIVAFSLACAVVGTVFATVRPGLFTPWYDLLLKVETWGWFGRWISKPLGLCHLCVSGQLALWLHMYRAGWDTSLHGISLHILASCIAILSAAGINKYWVWSTN